jgi:hypothetical protein
MTRGQGEAGGIATSGAEMKLPAREKHVEPAEAAPAGPAAAASRTPALLAGAVLVEDRQLGGLEAGV